MTTNLTDKPEKRPLLLAILVLASIVFIMLWCNNFSWLFSHSVDLFGIIASGIFLHSMLLAVILFVWHLTQKVVYRRDPIRIGLRIYGAVGAACFLHVILSYIEDPTAYFIFLCFFSLPAFFLFMLHSLLCNAWCEEIRFIRFWKYEEDIARKEEERREEEKRKTELEQRKKREEEMETERAMRAEEAKEDEETAPRIGSYPGTFRCPPPAHVTAYKSHNFDYDIDEPTYDSMYDDDYSSEYDYDDYVPYPSYHSVSPSYTRPGPGVSSGWTSPTANYYGMHGEFDTNDRMRAYMEDMQQDSIHHGYNPHDHGYDWDEIADARSDGYLD